MPPYLSKAASLLPFLLLIVLSAAWAQSPDPAVLEEGKALYSTYCVVCHGPQGLGDGAAAAGLNPKPRDLSALPEWAPVEGLAGHISEGKGTMPALQDSLSTAQINAVATYVKTLVVPGRFQLGQGMGNQDNTASLPPPDAGSLVDGKQLYSKYCSVCHGASGVGDGPAAMGLDPKPRNLTALPEWAPVQGLVGHMSQGIGDMPALNEAMTEAQMISVAHYVKSLVVPGKFQPGQGMGHGRSGMSGGMQRGAQGGMGGGQGQRMGKMH